MFRAIMVNKFYGFENDLLPELKDSLVQENTSIIYGIDLYDHPDLMAKESKFYIEYLDLLRDEERFLYPEYWILGYHLFENVHDEEFLGKLEMKSWDFLRKSMHLMKARTSYRMNPVVAHDILCELFWKPGEILDRYSTLQSIEYYDILTPIDVYNEFFLMFKVDNRLDTNTKAEKIYAILVKFILSLEQLLENPFSRRNHNIDTSFLWHVVIHKFIEVALDFSRKDLAKKIFELAKNQNHWSLFDDSIKKYDNFFYNND
jgi:hypothetical protein